MQPDDSNPLDDADEQALVRRARVPEALAGRRFDVAVAELFPEFSRSRLAAWIRSGKSRRALLPICCCHSTGSLAAPVITIFTAPELSSSLCHSDRSLMISS